MRALKDETWPFRRRDSRQGPHTSSSLHLCPSLQHSMSSRCIPATCRLLSWPSGFLVAMFKCRLTGHPAARSRCPSARASRAAYHMPSAFCTGTVVLWGVLSRLCGVAGRLVVQHPVPGRVHRKARNLRAGQAAAAGGHPRGPGCASSLSAFAIFLCSPQASLS